MWLFLYGIANDFTKFVSLGNIVVDGFLEYFNCDVVMFEFFV